MSSHHSKRFYQLHHAQVAGKQERVAERQETRQRQYIANTQRARMECLLTDVFGVFAFGFVISAIPVFLNYIIMA